VIVEHFFDHRPRLPAASLDDFKVQAGDPRGERAGRYCLGPFDGPEQHGPARLRAVGPDPDALGPRVIERGIEGALLFDSGLTTETIE
jgi:hypothetical protein